MDSYLLIPFQPVIAPLWLGFLVAGFLGLALGSFVTAMAYRLPREMKVGAVRSACTSCEHPLSFKDLVPFFSFMLQRGKCRYCQVSISWRYPLTELAMLCLSVMVFLRFGLSFDALLMVAIATCLLLLTVIDLEFLIIPDVVNLVLAVLCTLLGWRFGYGWEQMLIGSLALGCGSLLLRWVFFLWKGVEGLGLGDVKYLFAVGVVMPVEGISLFLMLSGGIGVAHAVLWQQLGYGKRFPFGPALAIAFFIVLLLPELMVYWNNTVYEIIYGWF